MRMHLFGLGLVVVASIGCTSSKATSPAVGQTTLQGTAALSSYPAAPRAVVASDETGRLSRATIAADGSFALKLRRAHTYRVDVITDAGSVPLVFPRSSGKVTTTFALKSDGAVLSLGAVHYVRSRPLTPLNVVNAVDRVAKTPLSFRSLNGGRGGSDDGNCEDCGNDDDQNVSCEDGSHGHGHGSDDMEGADDEAGSSGETSVAEHNVPENVDGCGVDENDDDNDGEHDDDHHENDGEETGHH